MITIDKTTSQGFFKGDAVKLTGKKDTGTYSVTLYEAEFIEGPNKGEKIWNPITTINQ